MIVCSCNVLNDRAVRRTWTGGTDVPVRVVDVFDRLGCRPRCGRCATTIRRLVRESIADQAATCPALIEPPIAPEVDAEPLRLLAAE